MRIVITGNIGCGKSTVSHALLAHLPGYTLVSADDLVRQLYEANAAFTEALIPLFGTFDRKAVARIAFEDAGRRAQLVALSLAHLNPVVDALFQSDDILVEFPLFYENPRWVAQADYVIALSCTETVQRERVRARDGLDDVAISRILAAQMPAAVKSALAHAHLDTSGPLVQTLAEVETLANQLQVEALRRRCNAFFQTDALWPHIAQAYSEPHRAYHTLTHLHELFEHLAPYENTANWGAIELAVWFHDFIYTTDESYAQNEYRSAQAMARLTRQCCPPDWHLAAGQQVLAAQLILATANHQVSPYLAAQAEARQAAELFLDADLAILAASPARVDAYDVAISREWLCTNSWVTPLEFRHGRREALTRLANRKPLFYSPDFSTKTAVACANLQQLIAQYTD